MISITGYDSRKQTLTPQLTTNSTLNNMTNRLSIVNVSRYNKQQQPVNLKQRVEQWDVPEHKRRHGHDHKLTDKHEHEQWGQKKKGSNKDCAISPIPFYIDHMYNSTISECKLMK